MVRKSAILFLLVLCGIFYLASCGSDSSINPEPTGHMVTGRIVDSEGEGVAGVTVKLSGADKTYSSVSVANGIYTFDAVTEGLYLVSCSKDDFIFSITTSEITVDGVITIPSIVAKAISLVPTPADGVTDISTSTILSWQVQNSPEGDITYDVKFGNTAGSLSFVATNQSDTSFSPEILEISTKYYWQVVLHHESGSFESPVWRFTTLEPINVVMASIPSGTFRMGDISGDGSNNARPVHDVTLSSFEMSIYETTQGQYQSVIDKNPAQERFGLGDNYPVYFVSWYNAVKYCNTLSDRAGFDRCYNESNWECDFSVNGYRLPTEAEWEYACRAGTETKLYTGNSESDLGRAGWYSGNASELIHPVGQKEPNAWGLYDMHGNVSEWCNDWYDSYYYSSSPLNSPTGPTSGSERVLRGGGLYSGLGGCRSARRGALDPTIESSIYSFRVVRRPSGVTY